MPYDERLAVRVRRVLEADVQGKLEEKRMFGGLAFLANGRMLCGVLKDELVLRVGKEKYEHVLELPGTRPMDITGRPMKGWILLGSDRCRTTAAIVRWLKHADEAPPQRGRHRLRAKL